MEEGLAIRNFLWRSRHLFRGNTKMIFKFVGGKMMGRRLWRIGDGWSQRQSSRWVRVDGDAMRRLHTFILLLLIT